LFLLAANAGKCHAQAVNMSDLIYIGIIAGFFAAGGFYVQLCDRL
jgi:hypothetical protein